MKYFLFIFFLVISLNRGLMAEDIPNIDDITYEWLVAKGAQTGYTDHVVVFKKIFNTIKVKHFLEFGLGYSTKYFLDSCTKVTSVEFISNGYGPDWYKKCLDLFRECPNWVPIAYFTGYLQDTKWASYKYQGSDAVFKAWAYQGSTHKNYALIDDFYLIELNAFIANLVKARPIEVAFVDSALLLRGDLVQLCFDKIPVIVAHDTPSRKEIMPNDVYGYSRIAPPENYQEIYLRVGGGSTVWVKKAPAYEGVIEELVNYAKSL